MGEPAPREGRDGALQASLGWLETLLWPERPRGDVRDRNDYAVFPSAKRPHLLIPLASLGAAARCIRQSTSATPLTQRITRAAISAAIRVGLAQRSLRTRVRLPAADGSPDVSLPAFLQRIVDREDVVMAITVGPVRANRKPVIEVLTKDGEPLAYVKVGWNEVTRPLVRRESEMLARLHGRAPAPEHFRVPEVIHAGTWRDLEVLAVQPAGETPWRLARPHLTLPLSATREVSELWGRNVIELDRNPYWERVRARASILAEKAATPIAGSLLPAAERFHETHGGTSVVFGTWHGDWVPWNMKYTAEGLVVWDWERSDGSAPVGLDAVHFDFQTRLWVRREHPGAALKGTLGLAQEYLEALGVPQQSGTLVVGLCMLEMALRLEEGAAAGVPLPRRIYEELPEILHRAVLDG